MPAYKKMRHATTLMVAALDYAKKQTIDYCFLEASPDGLALYKRIGFNPLFSNLYYEPL